MSRPKVFFLPLSVLVFFGLYLWAAILYPGGSQYDLHAEGFSFMHNYWCNLLNPEAMNGQQNLGRPFALLSLLVLCVGLAFFWYKTPQYFSSAGLLTQITRWSGLASIILALFIFSSLHDLVSIVSGVLGNVAFFAMIILLVRNKRKKLVMAASICVLFILINNLIYFSGVGIYYLPLLQKISFAYILGWFIWVDLEMTRDSITRQ